ncbi:MAG: hypothetical protein AAFP19_02095 [Bacteroidota bacterium]
MGNSAHTADNAIKHFTFEGRQKAVLLSFILLGAVCLLLSYFMDSTPHHSRFWTNYLINVVYFTGISFISLFVLAAFVTAYAGWYTVMKRIWEAYSQFLWVSFIFFAFLVLGVWMHWHHLYHWAMDGVTDPNSPNYDAILAGKAPFLNKYFFSIATMGMLAVWFFFAKRIRNISLQEDEQGSFGDFSFHRKLRVSAGIFLPIAAFSSAALIWQWVMSIDSHWYSTMFAWYATASWFVGCLSLTILLLIYLKSKGYYSNVTDEHMHDLGKFLFAFSVFWTYLWFSQYMLIWYANVGEETVYFHLRRNEYPVLFYGNLVINFFLPFFILMRNSTKRKYGTLAFTAILTFFGHWWDFFYMVKPSTLNSISHMDHSGSHGNEAELHGAAEHGAGGAHGAGHSAGDGHGEVAHSDGHGDHGHSEAGHGEIAHSGDHGDAAAHGADHGHGAISP